MNKLDGYLVKSKDCYIEITLNRKCNNRKNYFSNIQTEREKFLKSVNGENPIIIEDSSPKNRTFFTIKDEEEKLVLGERIASIKDI